MADVDRVRAPVRDLLGAHGEGPEPDDAAGSWEPDDEELLAAAEAWQVPPLVALALMRALFEGAAATWRLAQEPTVVELLPPGTRRRSPLVELASPVEEAARAHARAAVGAMSLEEWLEHALPGDVLAAAREGWDRARARMVRAYFQTEFPTAYRDRVAFAAVQRGPALLGQLLAYPGDASNLELLRALGGKSYDKGRAVNALVRFDSRVRRLREAEEDYSTPTWYEAAGYVIYSPVRGFTFGFLDPADLRDNLGISGASTEDMRRHVMSTGAGALVVGGLELAGSVAGLGKAAKALERFFGAVGASALTGGAASALSREARDALAAGDFDGFMLSVGAGALSAGVMAQLGQAAGMLGAVKGAGARGHLVAALGGAVAALVQAPQHGVTLEGVIVGALTGALSARRGEAAGAGRGGSASPGGAAAPVGMPARGARASLGAPGGRREQVARLAVSPRVCPIDLFT